jgi:hypothetical protein
LGTERCSMPPNTLACSTRFSDNFTLIDMIVLH